MGKLRRVDVGGRCYHVLNRANERATVFSAGRDYQAFERLIREAAARTAMRVLAFCVMPNHWHFVLWPRQDGDLARFAGWLAQTHALRLRAFRRKLGSGHVYQGRFKSLLIQDDRHLLTVCRYVEANPLRAALVPRAELWRWSSCWLRTHREEDALLFDDWPVPRPAKWLAVVNDGPAGMRRLRECIRRGRPYGDPEWTRQVSRLYGIDSVTNRRGRPSRI